MARDAYEDLATAIERVAGESDQTWQERAQRVIDACDENDNCSALGEFLAWLTVDDDGYPTIKED